MSQSLIKFPESIAAFIFPASNQEKTVNEESWSSLYTLTTFRLFLVLVLVLLFFTPTSIGVLGKKSPLLFGGICIAYALLSISFSTLRTKQHIPFGTQVSLQVYTDILVIVLLMHASAGVGTGLEILLILIVAVTGLLMAGQFVMSCALLSTCLILSEQAYTIFIEGESPALLQAGLLCTGLFAVAIFTQFLSRHQRASEKLAVQRSIDLEKLAELNKQIVQRMEQGILFVAESGEVKLFNQSLLHILHKGSPGNSALLADAFPVLNKAFSDWKTHENDQASIINDPDSGLELSVKFTVLPSLGTLLVVEDNESIAQRVQQLKLSSLGRLTASIAHQIRNPLGAISHAAQLQQESPDLSLPDQRLNTIVLNNAQRMNTIIEEILQLTRESKSLPHPISLIDELNQFIPHFCQQENTEQTIFENLPSGTLGTDPLINFSAGNLQQILGNLCHNSIQHGLRSDLKICFSVGCLAGDNRIFLDVADNGQGISSKQGYKIFEPFYTSSHFGSGLGLFIARELCEFNGAKLSLQASQTGTCFRITFMAAKVVGQNQ